MTPLEPPRDRLVGERIALHGLAAETVETAEPRSLVSLAFDDLSHRLDAEPGELDFVVVAVPAGMNRDAVVRLVEAFNLDPGDTVVRQ